MRIKRKIEIDSQPFDDIIFFSVLLICERTSHPFARVSVANGGERGRFQISERTNRSLQARISPRAVASGLSLRCPLATARGTDHRQTAPFRRGSVRER